MKDVKQKRKVNNNAGAFRRKCIRIIVYVCVFFIVLNRRLSVTAKKRLAVSFSGLVVAMAILFSLLGQGDMETTAQKISMRTTLDGSHNRVTTGHTEAKIELNRSRVLNEKEESEGTVTENPESKDGKAEQYSNASVVTGNRKTPSGDQPNKIEQQKQTLTQVQALLANNGESRQSDTVRICYQYPVELGHDLRQNYNRVQSAKDYIFRDVYDVTRGEKTEGGSPQAVSSQAVTFQTVLPQTVTAQAVTAQAVEGSDATEGTGVPVLTLREEKITKIRSNNKEIFCTNDNHIQVDASDGRKGSDIEEICYAYSDKLKYCVEPFKETWMEVPDDFYGRIYAKCTDTESKTSAILSEYFLVEKQAPEIQFSQDAFCAAPYMFWVNIGETGHIVSGVRDVTCTVDGKLYKITDLTENESTILDKGLEVPTKCEFSIPFAEVGSHRVVVTVTDYAGNKSTKETMIQVREPELISVFMPREFAIHIDPQQLAGREQIYSDDIILKNNSNFDVKVTVKNVQVTVKDEVSDVGVKKDCSLYMIAPDTGERIPLRKGKNQGVYSYCLPKESEKQIGKLQFVGETAKGSDEMWKDSDVVITVDLGFSREEK